MGRILASTQIKGVESAFFSINSFLTCAKQVQSPASLLPKTKISKNMSSQFSLGCFVKMGDDISSLALRISTYCFTAYLARFSASDCSEKVALARLSF